MQFEICMQGRPPRLPQSVGTVIDPTLLVPAGTGTLHYRTQVEAAPQGPLFRAKSRIRCRYH
jgi:hypothetical protein